MAYNSNRDSYECDFCGFELPWEASDEIHGEMWGCEECEKAFCSKCFIDRFGRSEYMKMMQGCDRIYCPDCWSKHREEVLNDGQTDPHP